MNKYQGLFIFPVALDDDALQKALDRACEEITKLGGEVEGRRLLGRKHFARPMRKQDAGVYARVSFAIPPSAVAPLRARYKLNEDLFRVQIVTDSDLMADDGSEPTLEAPPVDHGEERIDG